MILNHLNSRNQNRINNQLLFQSSNQKNQPILQVSQL